MATSIGISIGAVDCIILAITLRTDSAFITLDTKQAAVGTHLGLTVFGV